MVTDGTSTSGRMLSTGTEDCVILLVVASRNGEHSVASNLTDEGKIQLMKHVIDHMECKAPKKNLQ